MNEVWKVRWNNVKRVAVIGWGAVDFLLSNEVYTWASAIAFNALITFFPLIILCMAVAHTLSLDDLREHIIFVVRDYLPVSKDFISGTLRSAANKMGAVTWISAAVVLVSAVQIFVPVEIALNRIWKIESNRHWTRSLVLAYGLVVLCTILFAVPVSLSWLFSTLLHKVLFFLEGTWFLKAVEVLFLRIVALPFTIIIFACCYTFLPVRKMSRDEVLPAAIFTGVLWEIGRYVYKAALPFFDFQSYYGAFFVSVSLLTWALFSGMLMLFGAYLTAQNLLPKKVPVFLRRRSSIPPEIQGAAGKASGEPPPV